jgi:hypothetical protein
MSALRRHAPDASVWRSRFRVPIIMAPAARSIFALVRDEVGA